MGTSLQLIIIMAAGFNVLQEDSRTKFQHLASRFTSFVHVKSETDRQQVNSIFDELNALDFRSPVDYNADVSRIL